jgi:predicted enzyme related to lactoylglutathione lyase
MGKRESYEPGNFCWADLSTTDPMGAKAFYSELFGWEAEDIPPGEAGTYTMLRLDEDEVCALTELDTERRQQGIPPHWSSYVSMEDADATVARARELGRTVYGEAFDAGQMAVIQEPGRRRVCGLAARRARQVNDSGCLGWNELQTRDPERQQICTPASSAGRWSP